MQESKTKHPQLNAMFQDFADIASGKELQPIHKSTIHFDNQSPVVKDAEYMDAVAQSGKIRKHIKDICSEYDILLDTVQEQLKRHEDQPPTLQDFELLYNILQNQDEDK